MTKVAEFVREGEGGWWGQGRGGPFQHKQPVHATAASS